MSVEFENLGNDGVKVNIEVDCPCEVGICDHALVEVKKALQRSYDQGSYDGTARAMEEFKGVLKGEFPKEYKKAEEAAKKLRLN